jgi:hypothetical protein
MEWMLHKKSDALWQVSARVEHARLNTVQSFYTLSLYTLYFQSCEYSECSRDLIIHQFSGFHIYRFGQSVLLYQRGRICLVRDSEQCRIGASGRGVCYPATGVTRRTLLHGAGSCVVKLVVSVTLSLFTVRILSFNAGRFSCFALVSLALCRDTSLK